uniref:DUF4537 domain-containing protein n=1 Tax=Erpetoichthys calabaricus TaxID=27687 RepID=A0A8C4XDN8_ERPCA
EIWYIILAHPVYVLEINASLKLKWHTVTLYIAFYAVFVLAQTSAHKKILDPLKGQKVIARSEIDGFYYPGTVAKCIHSKRAIVEFKRGDVQIIPLDFVMSVGGAVPCPTLKIGDFVFVRTKAEDGGDCYVPAVVIATPVRTDMSYKFYTVLKYNNKKVSQKYISTQIGNIFLLHNSRANGRCSTHLNSKDNYIFKKMTFENCRLFIVNKSKAEKKDWCSKTKMF